MDPFFWKKLIASFVLPLPISVLLLLLALIFLLLKRLRKTSISCLAFAIVILFVFGTNCFPRYLLSQLESRYQALAIAPTDVTAIVVLGGGLGGKKEYPANTHLNSASLARLVEAVRLYRQLEQKGIAVKLILSGGRVFRAESEAGVLKNTAVDLGVNPQQIILENGSVDTYHEALYLKSIVAQQKFILVTSATHMPRAMALFKKQGMQPIPAPTQFLAHRWRSAWKRYIPSSTNLVYTDIALHEYLGMVWAKWHGEI